MKRNAHQVDEISESVAKELLYLFLQRNYRKQGYPWQETLDILRQGLQISPAAHHKAKIEQGN